VTVTVVACTAAIWGALTGSGFLAGRRDAVLRTAAPRAGDLRTDALRLALAGRFFLTELLFMELTIASNLPPAQKI
jgi:hypothetical protein